jgi:hypothetical protein
MQEVRYVDTAAEKTDLNRVAVENTRPRDTYGSETVSRHRKKPKRVPQQEHGEAEVWFIFFDLGAIGSTVHIPLSFFLFLLINSGQNVSGLSWRSRADNLCARASARAEGEARLALEARLPPRSSERPHLAERAAPWERSGDTPGGRRALPLDL